MAAGPPVIRRIMPHQYEPLTTLLYGRENPWLPDQMRLPRRQIITNKQPGSDILFILTMQKKKSIGKLLVLVSPCGDLQTSHLSGED